MAKTAKHKIIGVLRETFPGERRVALNPAAVVPLTKKGMTVVMEKGAGEKAGFEDGEYKQRGVEILADRKAVFERAGVILQVRSLGANPEKGEADLALLTPGQLVIGFFDPLSNPQAITKIAERKAIAFSMEMMPRITRAQSMDTLSSMATIAGYKAILLAANALPKMFPMMMTAAGTISPARVFVIGAGVAGLQAIASAKRMGAVVEAYDVRPVVKDQIESLGAKFLQIELDAAEAEDKGGYAKELGEDFYRKQRELMTKVLAACDVVITTAAIPGKKSPTLITREMVEVMQPGSVIVDLAAERGGNCELTEAGKTVVKQGVTILGPLNIPTELPYHASQMYGKNITTFLQHLYNKEGALDLERDDEIIRGTMLSRDGKVVHPVVQDLLGGGQ